MKNLPLHAALLEFKSHQTKYSDQNLIMKRVRPCHSEQAVKLLTTSVLNFTPRSQITKIGPLIWSERNCCHQNYDVARVHRFLLSLSEKFS